MQRLVVTCCWRIFHAHLLYSTASGAWTIPFVFINSYAASIAKHWAALWFGQRHPSSTAFRIAILASLNSKSHHHHRHTTRTTSHHQKTTRWNGRRLVHTIKTVWNSHWLVAVQTVYKRILSLAYSFFCLKLSPRARLEIIDIQYFGKTRAHKIPNSVSTTPTKRVPIDLQKDKWQPAQQLEATPRKRERPNHHKMKALCQEASRPQIPKIEHDPICLWIFAT